MGLGPLERLTGGGGGKGCSLTYLALESGKGCRTGEFQKKNVAFRFFLDQMFAANSNFLV